MTDYTLQPIPGKTLSRRLPEGTALVLEGGGLRGYYSCGVKMCIRDRLKLDCDALSIWNRKMQFAPEESKVKLYVEESGSKVWNGELKITK